MIEYSNNNFPNLKGPKSLSYPQSKLEKGSQNSRNE